MICRFLFCFMLPPVFILLINYYVSCLDCLSEGQLTTTFHFTPDDASSPHLTALLPLMSEKVGRVIANGFPTGVEVCHSMNHGGPWPATSDSRTTSVGSRAIFRWLRPLCFQNMPNELLPIELRDENIKKLRRLEGGHWKTE